MRCAYCSAQSRYRVYFFFRCYDSQPSEGRSDSKRFRLNHNGPAMISFAVQYLFRCMKQTSACRLARAFQFAQKYAQHKTKSRRSVNKSNSRWFDVCWTSDRRRVIRQTRHEMFAFLFGQRRIESRSLHFTTVLEYSLIE